MASTSEVDHLSEVFQAKFATNLYRALRSRENVVVSPLGVQILLAMMQQGAQGVTANEIREVLYHPQNNSEVLEYYKNMTRGLPDEFLKLAAKIFIEETFNISPEFQKVTTDYFLSDVTAMNFKNNPDQSRQAINDWAARATNNKINDFLSEGLVTAQTHLILANAIHFKAHWSTKFNGSETSDQPFYVSDENSVSVKMMFLDNVDLEYSESETLNAQIAALPYTNKEFRMIIILPRIRNDLDNVESKLNDINLIDEISTLQKMTVDLFIPRFKIETSLELRDVLKEMGMPTVFSRKADFSGISPQPLDINNVKQKALIEVNEEGTEAAAATAVESKSKSIDTIHIKGIKLGVVGSFMNFKIIKLCIILNLQQ